MQIRRKLLPITTFARIDIKRLFRDKVAIFFVFIFPLILLFIFGSIFNGDNNVSFRVALIVQSDTQAATSFAEQLKKSDILKIDENVTNLDAAKERMSRSSLDAAIVLPSDFGTTKDGATPGGQVQIIYDQNSEQAGRTLASVMEAFLKDVNSTLVATDMPFTVVATSTASKGLTQFDYTFSGILGFTLLSLGIFGPTSVFPRLKQRGVLRRYHTTTLKVWQYFTANVISNGFTGVLAIALMFAVGLLVFDLNMRGSYLSFLAMVILGASLMFGIGLAIGGWARNENQAAPMAQLVALPMMFLSGVFFPTFLMPEALQNITRFIPLTPVIDSFRMIITEGRSVLELGSQLVIILVWLIVVYFIAFRVFRWE